MKTTLKKLLALLLAMAISLSLCAPVWAEDEDAATGSDASMSAQNDGEEASSDADASTSTNAGVEEEGAPEENDSNDASTDNDADGPAEESSVIDDESEQPQEGEPTATEAVDVAEDASEEVTEEPEPEREANPGTNDGDVYAEAEDNTVREELSVQDDDNLPYKWQIYKKFLEYQKAGKAADFPYSYVLNGCTIQMTPVGDGQYDAVIDCNGLCTSDYPAYLDTEEDALLRGYESCFLTYQSNKITVEAPPSSVKALLNELNVKRANTQYTQPVIRTLTFGPGVTKVGQLQGFFGDNRVRNLVIPGNVKVFGTKKADGSLYDVFYNGNDKNRYEHFDSITIQEGVEEIGAHAFYEATISGGKGKIVLPKSVHTVNTWALAAYASEIEAKGSVNVTGGHGLNLWYGKKIHICGNLSAEPKAFLALEADVEHIVIDGDLILPHSNFTESVKRIAGPRLKTLTVGGNAFFGTGNFDDTPKFESLIVKGNAYFAKWTFDGFLYKTHIATPKKISIGGNATFESETVSNYMGLASAFCQIEQITVGGKVTQKKDSWVGTPFAGSGVKSKGTTKADPKKASSKLATVKITSIKTKKKTTTVKWMRNNTGTGYQLQYSTNKSFKKNVKTLKINRDAITSKKIKNLKKGKYYFRIRAIGKSATRTVKSDWSKVKTLKVAA